MGSKSYTTKQMGSAGEMLVAAELTLAGVPALRVPDNWPGYDVIAQPPQPDTPPQRISVKTRTRTKSGNFVGYANPDVFDWLAIVILPGPGGERRHIFIVPRDVADARSYDARPHRDGRGFFVSKVIETLAEYEDNFRLERQPTEDVPF